MAPPPKRSKKGGNKDDNPEKKARKGIDVTLGKAFRTRARYHQVTGQAAAFKQQVDTDEQYQWCCSSVLKALADAEEALAAAVKELGDFGCYLFSGVSAQELKRTHLEKDLEAKVRDIPGLEPQLNKVQGEVQRLMRIHAARLSK